MALSKKLQIAFCPPELQPLQLAMRGDPTNATYLLQSHIAQRLLSRGHKLTYIAQRDLGDNVCTTDLENPVSTKLTWSNSAPFITIQKATWLIQRILGIPYLNVFTNLRLYDACLRCLPGHDIVYERNGLFRNGIAMACRRLKIPYVLFVEADEILEHDYMERPLIGLLRKSAGRQFYYNLMAADCIICVSDPLKSHLVSHWNIPAQKISVFSNGVDVNQFKPNEMTGGQVRASLGISDNPMLLFVGNFYEWHDVATVLHSFSHVLERYPNGRLVLVGDGALREKMQQLAIDLDISKSVHFTGLIPHADVPRYMAAADIAVVPYPKMPQENWLSPLKLFEYMASAKAIVASSVGQVVNIIQHEKNGLLISPGDPLEMASAISRLIENQDLRVRLGQQARADTVRYHSWEQYITRLENVFANLIEKGNS